MDKAKPVSTEVFKMNYLYILFAISVIFCHSCDANCQLSRCSGHGVCNSINNNKECECYKGWGGPSCSIKTCVLGKSWFYNGDGDFEDQPLVECSGVGICDKGKCDCQDGFVGNACQRMSCPINSKNGLPCSGKGVCIPMKQHSKSNYRYPNYFEYKEWDANMIYGCECDSFHTGYDCSLEMCPIGLDPLITITPSILLYTCKPNPLATDGTFSGKYTPNIFTGESREVVEKYLNDLLIGTVVVDFYTEDEASGERYNPVPFICREENTIINITIINPNQDINTIHTAPGTDEYGNHAYHWIVPTHLQEWKYSNSHLLPCSGRGICNYNNGECDCDPQLEPKSNGIANCGKVSTNEKVTELPLNCPLGHNINFPNKTIVCSGNGICNKNEYKCDCYKGYEGHNCELKSCPKGRSWFDWPINEEGRSHTMAMCSNKGNCNYKTGECECEKGFTGLACELLDCPSKNAFKECSGNGKCITVSELSSTPPSYYYYTPDDDMIITPNKWQIYSLRKCKCELGYKGIDCSIPMCPYGPFFYDIADYNNNNTNMSPYVKFECKLSKENVHSDVIIHLNNAMLVFNTNNTIDEVKEILKTHSIFEKLQEQEEVNITSINIDNNNQICSKDGNNITIYFPKFYCAEDIIIDFEYQTNDLIINPSNPEVYCDKKCYECSGNGICNIYNKECNCYSGFYSSNGVGLHGYKGDCGYYSTSPLNDGDK